MSQPPKSTIFAPSARWASLRGVLRVMAASCGKNPLSQTCHRGGVRERFPLRALGWCPLRMQGTRGRSRSHNGFILAVAVAVALDLRGPSVAAESADKTRRGPHMDVRRFPRGQDALSENPE